MADGGVVTVAWLRGLSVARVNVARVRDPGHNPGRALGLGGLDGVLGATDQPAHDHAGGQGPEQERARPLAGEPAYVVEQLGGLAAVEVPRQRPGALGQLVRDVRSQPGAALGHPAEVVAEGGQGAGQPVLLLAALVVELPAHLAHGVVDDAPRLLHGLARPPP